MIVPTLNPALVLASYSWLRKATPEELLSSGVLDVEQISTPKPLLAFVLSDTAQLALWSLMQALRHHTDDSRESTTGFRAYPSQWETDRPKALLYLDVPELKGGEEEKGTFSRHLEISLREILEDAEERLVLPLKKLGF